MLVLKLLATACVAAAAHERSKGFFATPDAHPMQPDASLSVEGKSALRKLLHDLVEINGDMTVNTTFGVRKGQSESREEFMPKCLAHVKELVHDIDRSYTDVQLKNVLTQECQLSKEFPRSNPSNFQSHEACLKFAEKLSDARMEELETGKTDQYQEFCKEYYDHAAVEGQKVVQEKKELRHPLPEGQSLPKDDKPKAEAKPVEKSAHSAAARVVSGFAFIFALGAVRLW